MRKIKFILTVYCLFAFCYGFTGSVNFPMINSKIDSVQDKTVKIDSMNAIIIYENAFKKAMYNRNISREEANILNSLERTMKIPKKDILSIQQQIISIIPKKLDQSGRWPLVLQNIGWGGGLYGWAIPNVLGAKDMKWIVGTEMMSFAGAFYLTYKYTKNMDISHSRAQMMRAGSGIGFHMGWAICDLLGLSPGDDKSALILLMSGVPTGIYAGDYLYNKWKPSHGQSWSLTLWATMGLHTLSQLFLIVDPRPEEPDDGYWDYSTYTWVDNDEEYAKWEDDINSWKKRLAIIHFASYPLGIYTGEKFFGDRQYSFGDALMLFQGYGLGWMYSAMTADLLGIDFFSTGGRLARIGGTIGGTLFFDNYIKGYDYSFGDSFLMALGTASGMAFNMGLAAILEVDNASTMQVFLMSGGAAGFYFTNKILSIGKESKQISQSEDPTLSIASTFFIEPNRSDNLFTKIVPGINVEINF